SGNTLRGRLLRAFLPSTLLIVLIGGWTDVAFGERWATNPALSHSLTALAGCGLMVAIIGWIARSLGNSLEQAQARADSLARLPDENPCPVLRVTPQGQLLYANGSSQPLLQCWNCVEPGQWLPEAERRRVAEAFAHSGSQDHEVACGNLTYALVLAPVLDMGYLSIYGCDITMRVYAEESLRRSEERYRELFESSHDAIMTLESPSWRFTSCNAATLAMFGVNRREDFEALGPWDVSPRRQPDGRDTADKAREMIETALCKGSHSFEWTHKQVHGAEFPAAVQLTRMKREGRIILQATVRDITEQKRAEKALRDSEARVRAITDSAQDAILMMDPQGRISYWNSAAEHILGFTADESIGQTLHELIVPDRYHAAHAGAMPEFRHSGRGGAIGKTLELHALRKDGREINVDLSLSAVRMEDGWHAVGIVRDITERKQAERALRESEERYRSLFDMESDAIFLVDNETGRILEANSAASALYGYSREEFLVRKNTDLSAEPEETQQTSRSSHVATDNRVTVPLRIHRKKDGSEFPVEMTGRFFTWNGRPVHISAIRDVTERQRAESAERQRRTLAEAVQAMEGVLGVMGHELRTPLAAVRGMAEFLVAEGSQAAGAEGFLKSIHDQTVRMAEMVNNMLEAARLDSGLAQWNFAGVALGAVCDEALGVVRPLIDPGRVNLSHSVDPPELSMTGDSDAIRRLIINLLTNAAKYTTEGSIAVALGPTSRAGRPYVELRVRDTGEGIPPEHLKKLGQAFALNSGVVGGDHVKGSGLGLAICRGIVAAHGGSISVDSAPDKGSTFTVLLRADLTDPVQHPEHLQITREVTI
ncbi:MAG: PAS domain S-box protein, partial [Tepidisphaerales bacterium]